MVLISFFLTGCFSNTIAQSSYIRTPEVNDVSTTATFSIGETKDLSEFVFDNNDADAFNLTEAMTAALQQLVTKGIFNVSGEYIINTNIISYAPGNAFKRWLFPAFGTTKLFVECSITDIDGNEYAKIPVEAAVIAGGFSTVGAWKYIFNDVANEIAKNLRNPKKRNTQ
jgi:hypothetical protein